MLPRVKRRVRNFIAALVRDRRVREPYTYHWLNGLCGKIVAESEAAEIRPAYTWGVIHAAALARRLGCSGVSVIEFGVAGGRGLTALERIAEIVERRFSFPIHVFGFDTGRGLPKPVDARDLPQLYSPDTYVMDEARLRSMLRRAHLIIGPVAETLPSFISGSPAPLALCRSILTTTRRRWMHSGSSLRQPPCCFRGFTATWTTSWERPSAIATGSGLPSRISIPAGRPRSPRSTA